EQEILCINAVKPSISAEKLPLIKLPLLNNTVCVVPITRRVILERLLTTGMWRLAQTARVVRQLVRGSVQERKKSDGVIQRQWAQVEGLRLPFVLSKNVARARSVI